MEVRTIKMAMACLAMLVVTGQVKADIVVDQSQLSNTVTMANFNQTDLAQSFQQFADNITGAEIFLRDGVGDGGSGDITISLWDALPNAGGLMIASGTDSGVSAGEFATVDFGGTPGISIDPGTTYFLVFESTNLSLGVAGDTNNPYDGGNVFANPGFQPFSGFDYTFQTFAHVGGVPEPTSLALLSIGAIGMVIRRRRK